MSIQSPSFTRDATGYAGSDAGDWVAQWAEAKGYDDDAQFAMRLCVDELVTNWTQYGLSRPPENHHLRITAHIDGPKAIVEVFDDGRPFDLNNAEDPGQEGNIETATVGGRGIRLMRAFSQELIWRGHADGNHTTFVFKPEPIQGM